MFWEESNESVFKSESIPVNPFTGWLLIPCSITGAAAEVIMKKYSKNKNVKNDSTAYLGGEILNIIFLANEGKNLPLDNHY